MEHTLIMWMIIGETKTLKWIDNFTCGSGGVIKIFVVQYVLKHQTPTTDGDA